MPGKLGEIVYKGEPLLILQSSYKGGRVAIFLTAQGSLFATLTINLPKEEFEAGEFPVKDWTENEEITPFVLEHTDLFEDTGKTAPTGRVEAPIWRFKKEE